MLKSLPCAPDSTQIGTHWRFNHPPENGGKSRDAFVAQVQSHRSHGLAMREARQCRKQTCLLPPRGEADPGFPPEGPGESAAAHVEPPGPAIDGLVRIRRSDEGAAERRQPLVAR